MGLWSHYFFAKFFLYAGQHIDFHVLPNLAFATVLIVPLKRRWMLRLRQLAAVPAGIALFYYDSWLPPFERLLAQAGSLQQFNVAYLVELIGRFFNPMVLAGLLAALVGAALLGRKLRLSTFAFVGILAIAAINSVEHLRKATPGALFSRGAIPLTQTALTDAQLGADLQTFYQTESRRRVLIEPPNDPGRPFDIIMVHVCSMSWDDLAAAGNPQSSLMSRFDIGFRQFNSAASYSGPAAIRLLRGDCGQTRHESLYEPADACNLFEQLRRSGFQPQWLMNHDGHFGDFAADVRERGGLTVPMEVPTQTRVALRAFDDSPIYDDAEVLAQWWQKRLDNPASRVALYYNSISLHDGNHSSGVEARAPLTATYRKRLDQLLEGLDRFIAQVNASGRKAVVILVPEHGAALRGDRMQISGLREIPTPAITLVPVAVKLVGFDATPTAPLNVDTPTSYLALTTLIGNFVAHNPFESSHPPLEDYVQDLPQTALVSENEGMVMMRTNQRDMLRNPDLSWSEYIAQSR